MLNTRVSTRALPRRLLWTWLVLLCLSRLADLLTTWRSLAVGLREDNPVVAATLGSGHLPLFALVKVVLVVALGTILMGGRPAALAGARLVVVAFCLIASGT